MKVDYIIVGLGLAGLSFCEELLAAGKSFVVFEDNSQTSSLVAGGVYNPVILKRFTPVWNAKDQLIIALPFYKKLEEKLSITIDEKFVIKKAFKSIEDQNNWFAALDKPKLKDYLDSNLDRGFYKGVVADFNYGNVKHAGRIDTKKLVLEYREFLKKQDILISKSFNYDELLIQENILTYNNFLAERIVFCEGFGITKNPYFKYLPLNEAKGELITILAPELKIDFLLKSSLFVMPLGNNHYKVGATFNWTDKTSHPTEEGKNELIEKLKKVIDTPYKIISQSAGIRPTVAGRRPLIGTHPIYDRLHVLNGLGTRGVMIGPTIAKNLFNHLENKEDLDEEVDIKRFKLK